LSNSAKRSILAGCVTVAWAVGGAAPVQAQKASAGLQQKCAAYGQKYYLAEKARGPRAYGVVGLMANASDPEWRAKRSRGWAIDRCLAAGGKI
jgi:hypothetical protein